MLSINAKQKQMFAAWVRKQKAEPLANYIHLQANQGSKDSATLIQQWDNLQIQGAIPESLLHRAIQLAIDQKLVVTKNDRTLACTLALSSLSRTHTYAILEAYALWAAHKKRTPTSWDTDILKSLQSIHFQDASPHQVTWAIWCQQEHTISNTQFKDYIQRHLVLKSLRALACFFAVEDGILGLVRSSSLIDVLHDSKLHHNDAISFLSALELHYQGQATNIATDRYINLQLSNFSSAMQMAKRLDTFYTKYDDVACKLSIHDITQHYDIVTEITNILLEEATRHNRYAPLQLKIEQQKEAFEKRIHRDMPTLLEAHRMKQQLGYKDTLHATFLQMQTASTIIEQPFPNLES